jgi:exo-beta-1,3-glucanase (GH17 family)
LSIFNKISILFVMLILLAACGNKPSSSSDDYGPKAADIFGNPDYQAFSYGGYLEKTRDIAPTHEQITEDLKILAAMGVKILRTYNTSQFPQAALLLNAIKELKATDPDFEMYLMLGAWIEAQGSWRPGTDHSQGNVDNNTKEIDTAVAMANEYPDIVKAIAVGNEAMVQWAVNYFVYPKTILKWVNHLQSLKASGQLNSDIWITSSDNYESWGGGSTVYHTDDLVSLINAVDFLSVHTYPFHDSFYNQDFWGVLPDEEQLPKTQMIDATMKRAVEYGASQYQGVVNYLASLNIDKPMHIGETGWASSDSAAYGAGGSKAADEYKEKMFYQYMREWTDTEGISLFYFEAFDEQWKDSADGQGSENHFGLITLNNEVKYALWSFVDSGQFDGLTRSGQPLIKSYSGDENALLAGVLKPPFKSTMPVRKISTVNSTLSAGDTVIASHYLVSHDTFVPASDNQMTYPSAGIKLVPWEGTASIEMSPEGVIAIATRTSEWWGASLEFQGAVGEDLSEFSSGALHFDIKGDADIIFSLGFQTGRFLQGNQVNSFVAFGKGTAYPVSEQWRTYKLSIDDLNKGTNMQNVTGILSFLSRERAENKQISIKNIYYSQ